MSFLPGALFLDRDGILNEALVRDKKPYPPHALREIRIIPDVVDIIKEIRRMDVAVIVVTNQPDFRRGLASKAALQSVHSFILSKVDVDLDYICFHDNSDNCSFRKPGIGALLDARERLQIDLEASVMVGDRYSDVMCANFAGCHSVLVNYDYDQILVEEPDCSFSTAAQALEYCFQYLGGTYDEPQN